MRGRLRRLENRYGPEGCPECAGGQGFVLTYGDDAPRQECCPRCERPLTIIRVVEEGDEEGGG
jgi:hypothetical protein